jgi:hypothetical protein
MIQIIVFSLLTVLSIAAFVGILLLSAQLLLARIRKKTKPGPRLRLKRTALRFAAAMVFKTRARAPFPAHRLHAPHCGWENGHTPENSIAELYCAAAQRAASSGSQLRGWDKNKPSALFGGGPGGTQMAACGMRSRELEGILSW